MVSLLESYVGFHWWMHNGTDCHITPTHIGCIMIKYVKGDLIELGLAGEFDLIIHGANVFHTMGAGIARQIREKIPEAYAADKETPYGKEEKVGTYSKAIKKTAKKVLNMDSRYEYKYLIVINAYTQFAYSRNGDVFSYEGFEKILKDIDNHFPYETIGLPLIGCGLAGGNKERILKIIGDTIGHRDVTIVEWN
jgi:O-acetyl-ADP-ribose deacetylase (regulator of RNase III)